MLDVGCWMLDVGCWMVGGGWWVIFDFANYYGMFGTPPFQGFDDCTDFNPRVAFAVGKLARGWGTAALSGLVPRYCTDR